METAASLLHYCAGRLSCRFYHLSHTQTHSHVTRSSPHQSKQQLHAVPPPLFTLVLTILLSITLFSSVHITFSSSGKCWNEAFTVTYEELYKKRIYISIFISSFVSANFYSSGAHEPSVCVWFVEFCCALDLAVMHSYRTVLDGFVSTCLAPIQNTKMLKADSFTPQSCVLYT